VAYFARILGNPNNPGSEAQVKDVQTAGHGLGRQLSILMASTESEIDAAFATLVQRRAGALLVGSTLSFSPDALNSWR
jgi:putative ABC transport system substrate-binding protein